MGILSDPVTVCRETEDFSVSQELASAEGCCSGNAFAARRDLARRGGGKDGGREDTVSRES